MLPPGIIEFIGAFAGGAIAGLAISKKRIAALERQLDDRVVAAFAGAQAPLLTALTEVTGRAVMASKSADAAHRRIDEYLGKRP